MKISFKHFLFFAFLFLLPAAVFGQGSGSSEPKKDREKSNFAVTRSVNGIVKSANRNSVVVQSKNGNRITLNITQNTRLSRSCLQTGTNVRATYTPKDRKATIIRCK